MNSFLKTRQGYHSHFLTLMPLICVFISCFKLENHFFLITFIVQGILLSYNILNSVTTIYIAWKNQAPIRYHSLPLTVLFGEYIICAITFGSIFIRQASKSDSFVEMIVGIIFVFNAVAVFPSFWFLIKRVWAKVIEF